MKGLYQSFPAFAPDYVGVSSFLFDENALTVFIDPHGCNGQTLYYMDPRFEDFSRMPKSFSCGIREKDAVFGVDKLVEKKVMQILDCVQGDYIILVGTPIPTMLGVDYKALTDRIEKRAKIPTLGVTTSGLDFYDVGQKKIMNLMLNRTETQPESFESEESDIHLIGATPLDGWDYTAIFDYTAFLKKCGANTVDVWGQGNTFQKMKGVGKSKLNIAVSVAGIEIAQRLNHTYGTPYLIGYPIGSVMEEYYAKLVEFHLDEKCGMPILKMAPDTEQPRILIIGSPVNSCMIRKYFGAQEGMTDIDIGFCFGAPVECKEENDFVFFEEEELHQTIKQKGKYDIIIGDPLFKNSLFSFAERYVEFPEISISGRLYSHEMKRVFGKWGDNFFM